MKSTTVCHFAPYLPRSSRICRNNLLQLWNTNRLSVILTCSMLPWLLNVYIIENTAIKSKHTRTYTWTAVTDVKAVVEQRNGNDYADSKSMCEILFYWVCEWWPLAACGSVAQWLGRSTCNTFDYRPVRFLAASLVKSITHVCLCRQAV